MGKLIRNILLLTAPIVVLVFLWPMNKRWIYQGLKEDCYNHGLWIHDRLLEQENDIDIAFLGSSHTINGVNDSLIEKGLSAYNMKVVNLGYCRLGRNLQAMLCKELLQKHTPRILVLEVRVDENHRSHPIFPYLADNQALFSPRSLLNPDGPQDVYKAFMYRLQMLQEQCWSQEGPAKSEELPYGFGTFPDKADVAHLERMALERSQPHSPSPFRSFNLIYPLAYVDQIAAWCIEADVELMFLYLPAFGQAQAKPLEYEQYAQHGKVMLPPRRLLKNMDYWFDDQHLNLAGADALGSWLVEELGAVIVEQNGGEE